MRFPIKSFVWIPLAIAVTLACSGCQTEEATTAKKDQAAVESKSLEKLGPDTNADSASTEEPLFTVDVYDPKRDASKDLEMTVAKAKKSRKRILLEVGGKW